jgi:catalase
MDHGLKAEKIAALKTFAGRRVGALVTDGVDSKLLNALEAALQKEGAQLKIVAPMVGGVKASDGSWIEGDEKIDGGPSVLFDAVAILVSEEGVEWLQGEATARDFIADAVAHMKFIGYSPTALPLLQQTAGMTDAGFIELSDPSDVPGFVQTCRMLRFWEREEKVKRS